MSGSHPGSRAEPSDTARAPVGAACAPVEVVTLVYDWLRAEGCEPRLTTPAARQSAELAATALLTAMRVGTAPHPSGRRPVGRP